MSVMYISRSKLVTIRSNEKKKIQTKPLIKETHNYNSTKSRSFLLSCINGINNKRMRFSLRMVFHR
jgi:hypothetical protein